MNVLIDSPIGYLIFRFFYHVYQFLYDWYVKSFKWIAHQTVGFLESLDRIWAVKINLKNIFEPLYQDRTFTGHILGFIFRSLRIIIGSLFYIVVIAIGVAAYLGFAAIPLFVIYWGFGS